MPEIGGKIIRKILPIIYAMEDKVHGPRIAELFGKVDVTDDDVKEAIDLIRKTDAVDRCIAKAESFADDAVSHLDEIPESIYKKSMLMIADYIVRRDR